MSVLGWRPEDLAAAADEIVAARNSLVGIDADLASTRPPPAWNGEASLAAAAAFGSIDDGYLDHIAELSAVVGALDDAALAIRAALDEVAACVAQIRALGRDVRIEGDLVTLDATAPQAGGETGSEAASLCDRIVAAIAAARAADTTLAGLLSSVARGGVDTTVTSARQAALPAHLQGLGAAELADLALTDPDAVNGFTGFLSHAERNAIAEALAAANADLAGPVPSGASGAEVDTQVAAVARATHLLSGDTLIAAGTLASLGAGGFVGVQARVRARASQAGSEAGAPHDHQEAMRRLLERGTLDGAVDPAWVTELTRVLDDSAAAVPHGHQALAALLVDQTGVSSTLLAAVTDAVVTRELALGETGATWRSLDPGAAGATWLDDPVGPLLGRVAADPAAASEFLDSLGFAEFVHLEQRYPQALEEVRSSAAQHAG